MNDPFYNTPRQAGRGPNDARGVHPSTASSMQFNGRQADNAESIKNRAAKYEDEKRRIIESCFSKKDPDGVMVESYITHVRVTEDAMYPSSPPPPDSTQSNKKNRVILVAVRRSGRVRVHKARENPSGTFSIGKTWALDELSSIHTYIAPVTNSNREQTEKQWAGDTGFVVTLGKPYYWQALTSKEKDFFIASLIKIYRKYTGGRLPELSGFEPRDMELLTGGLGSRGTPDLSKQSPSPMPASPTPPPPVPAASERRPQSPYVAPNNNGETRRGPSNPPFPGRSEVPFQFRDAPNNLVPEALRPPSGGTVSPFPPSDTRPQRPVELAATQPTKELNTYAAVTEPPRLSQPLSTIDTNLPFNFGTEQPTLITPRSTNGASAETKPQYPSWDRAGSAQANNDRPNTALSVDTTNISRPSTSHEPIPDKSRLYVNKAESINHSQSALTSEANSRFVTPATTPSLVKSEPEAAVIRSRHHEATRAPSGGPINQTDYFSQPSSVIMDEPASTTSPADASALSIESSMIKSTGSEQDGLDESSLSMKSDEEHRPGLGPMIKKRTAKDVANQMRKAVVAANAFKPREGGAVARIRAMKEKEKSTGEPDGITGVVPAPLLRGMSTDSVMTPSETASSIGDKERPLTPLMNSSTPKVHLERAATEDSVTTLESPPKKETQPDLTQSVRQRPASPEKARSRSPQRRKRQRQEAEIVKYCAVLKVEPQTLDGKGADFNDLLTEFGWEGKLAESQKVDDFEAEVRREIGRAQATGWLGHVEQQESKVQELAKAFERAIDECEELDGLFTLYSHELDTLAADIEYIEAQSQGLQVQTANQKLLHKELQNLLSTLTISSSELNGLQAGSFDSTEGVGRIEESLALLYKALLTIDPEIRHNRLRQAEGAHTDRSGVGVYADPDIGQMRAVLEKKEDYREASQIFIRRFNQYMNIIFKRMEQHSNEELPRSPDPEASKSLEPSMRQKSRNELWMYSPLMLFVRDVNSYEWQTLITSYEMNVKSTFQDQFRDNVMARRRGVHKPTGEEQEVLFTMQEREKSDDSLAYTAARKLTVKRSKTNKTITLKQSFGEKRDGKPDGWEVFDSVLQQQAKVISEEQNFIVHFFHLNSQTNLDFAEIVSSTRPDERHLPNLSAKQSYDPDRNMAKIVQQVVEGIYSFWMGDTQNLIDWVLSLDQLQGVGVLCSIELTLATYEETNQEYLTRTLRSMHERLVGLFHKFVDEQIKAIEETKVKIKKRKGIISFMRTFPVFSATIENMIPSNSSLSEPLEIRYVVNDAYTKILKAMWESLAFIAKDDPASGPSVSHSTAPSSGDPEDKEALNYHILLIENMSHFVDEVETEHNVVLEGWAARASHDMYTHLTQYTDAVIRRPLGKWLDFLESTESMMKTSTSYQGIAGKPSHSRSAAKKVLKSYDSNEIRKGIDTLKKRIEKHFGDIDDATPSSKSLILKVFEGCGSRYSLAHDRMKIIIDKVYDGNLEMDWRKEEVIQMFKR